MLFLIMGASGSGKSSCLAGLKRFRPEVDWRDFDDALTHPSNTASRQLTTEYWLQVALGNQGKGRSTGVLGTMVFGEVLACPSAPAVEGICSLLLDCADLVRIDRIRARDGQGAEGASQDMLCWAAWLRMHASDPQWRQDVIQAADAPGMRWERWSAWGKGDGRWAIPVLENSLMSIEETTDMLLAWVDAQAGMRSCPGRGGAERDWVKSPG